MEPEISLEKYPIATATAVLSSVATAATPARPLARTSAQLSADQVRTLVEQGYPSGLVTELGKSCVSFPRRYWIVDNSGSMRTPDVSVVLWCENFVILSHFTHVLLRV
jgi:hypothetical protein